MTRRTEQVGDLIKEELSRLLEREAKDPRIGFVTLTDVEVSPDLSLARVYFSVLGDEQRMQESLAALARARGFLRRELSQRLSIRSVPDLQFHLDRSIERGQRIADLLRQAHQQEDTSNGA
jgi:ribosome-binding factor A